MYKTPMSAPKSAIMLPEDDYRRAVGTYLKGVVYRVPDEIPRDTAERLSLRGFVWVDATAVAQTIEETP